MATDPYTNPTDELDGLLAAFQAAVSGRISRAVTVRHRDYDGFWPGPWPLILLRLDTFTLRRISGGHTGSKGQQGSRTNLYTVEIQDALKPRDHTPERVGAAQSDLYALITAITAYFDHVGNQTLPVGGVATATRAGEAIDFKVSRPFQAEDGGDVRIVAAGKISVLGLPRPGLDP
jgi:hypothetical protein